MDRKNKKAQFTWAYEKAHFSVRQQRHASAMELELLVPPFILVRVFIYQLSVTLISDLLQFASFCSNIS